jgi:hypothetical protein
MNKAMEQIEARIEILKSKKEEFEEKKAELEKRLIMLDYGSPEHTKVRYKIKDCVNKIEMFSDLLKTNHSFYLYYSICPTNSVN